MPVWNIKLEVANCDFKVFCYLCLMEVQVIQSKIYEVRGLKVMLDSDLAELYGVETRVLNQAVKRNIERFPERFMFQLTKEETLKFQNGISSSRSQFVILNNGRGSNIKYMPYAFTEQGVSMLSAVLRSPTAVQVSISIMDAFVMMRNYLTTNAVVTAELAEIRAKLAMLEHNDEETLEALNDLSEDLRRDIDNIYTAIGELSIKPVKPREPIGYKK